MRQFITFKEVYGGMVIIEMDAYPLPNWPWKCVTIPESCLERI